MEIFSHICTYTARKGKIITSLLNIKTRHCAMHIRHLTQAVLQVKTLVPTSEVKIVLILHAPFLKRSNNKILHSSRLSSNPKA